MAQHSAALTSAVLRLFPSFANDVSLVETAASLLSQLADSPGSLEAMAAVGVPILLAQLQAASQEGGTQGAFKAEGILDLLCSFITPSHQGAPMPRLSTPAIAPGVRHRCPCESQGETPRQS